MNVFFIKYKYSIINFCEIMKLFVENWLNKGRWKIINIVIGVIVKINKMEIISVFFCILFISFKYIIYII